MTDKKACCSYIFLDESGNFDFSPSGTRYFVLTSVSMKRPFPLAVPMDDYKHDRLEYGLDLEYFHCYRDGKIVRNRVFELIASHLDGMRIDCLIVEKAKVEPALQADRRFYPEVLTHLLKLILPVELDDGDAEKVIVITDTIPVKQKAASHRKGCADCIARYAAAGNAISHSAPSIAFPLRIAGGGLLLLGNFSEWQTGERTWYDRIKPAIRRELDLFHAKSRCYY